MLATGFEGNSVQFGLWKPALFARKLISPVFTVLRHPSSEYPPSPDTVPPSPRDSVCCDPLLRRLLAWWRWCIVGLLGEAQVRAPSSGPWRCTVCAAATSHVVGQVHGRSEITASCGTQTQLKTSCTAPSDGGVRSLLTCLHPVDGGWGLSSDPQSPSLAAHWIFGSTRGSYQMCGLGAYCHIHWSCWGKADVHHRGAKPRVRFVNFVNLFSHKIHFL